MTTRIIYRERGEDFIREIPIEESEEKSMTEEKTVFDYESIETSRAKSDGRKDPDRFWYKGRETHDHPLWLRSDDIRFRHLPHGSTHHDIEVDRFGFSEVLVKSVRERYEYAHLKSRYSHGYGSFVAYTESGRNLNNTERMFLVSQIGLSLSLPSINTIKDAARDVTKRLDLIETSVFDGVTKQELDDKEERIAKRISDGYGTWVSILSVNKSGILRGLRKSSAPEEYDRFLIKADFHLFRDVYGFNGSNAAELAFQIHGWKRASNTISEWYPDGRTKDDKQMIQRADDHNQQRRQIIKKQAEEAERARRSQGYGLQEEVIQATYAQEENHNMATESVSPPKSEAAQIIDALFEKFSTEQFEFQKNLEPLIRAELESNFNERVQTTLERIEILDTELAQKDNQLVSSKEENDYLRDKMDLVKNEYEKKIKDHESTIIGLRQQVSDLIINKDTQTETDISYNRIKQLTNLFGQNKKEKE